MISLQHLLLSSQVAATSMSGWTDGCMEKSVSLLLSESLDPLQTHVKVRVYLVGRDHLLLPTAKHMISA